MPTYETLFITPPTLSDDEEKSTVAMLAAIVTDGGGVFTANERMGRRRLAYPIRKFEDGVYMRFLYDCEVEIPKELERRIRISDNVLRSLTVRLEDNWAEAAKVQAVKDAERRAEMEAEAAQRAAEEAERAAAAPAPVEEGAESPTPEVAEAAPAEETPTAEESSEPAAEEAPKTDEGEA